jgi:hypothetical protein
MEVILKQKPEKILASQRRDILWSVYGKTKASVEGRELVIDVSNVTAISKEGENMPLDLVNEGVRFRSSGVFTKQVLRQLTRRNRLEHWGIKEMNYLQANSSGSVRAGQLQKDGG